MVSKNEQGFTLLEVLIALAIMLLAFASVLSVESGAINASAKAKQMNIVAMLARNQMTETEYKIEGKTFDEMKKEESGTFPTPFEDYRWKSEIKEITFPPLNFSGPTDDKSSSSADAAMTDTYTKLLSQFISKALREINITIYWKRGSGEQHFSVATYWVNLNQEFELQ